MLEFESIPENEIIISEALKKETEKEFPILKRYYDQKKDAGIEIENENETFSEADESYYNNMKYAAEKTPAVQNEIDQIKEEEIKEKSEASITNELKEIAELKEKDRTLKMNKAEKNEYLGKTNYDHVEEKIEDMIKNREEKIERNDLQSEGVEEVEVPEAKEELQEESTIDMHVADDFRAIDIDYTREVEYYEQTLRVNRAAGENDLQKESETKLQMMQELNGKYKDGAHEKVVKEAKHFVGLEKNDPSLSRDFTRSRDREQEF